jgi:putative nucleotidyltransferase with HDIG domain
MSDNIPTREAALELFKKYNKTESLLKHALSVEAVMRYMAKKAGEDEDKWGIIGLIHDLDYEMYPEQHCKMTEKILTENNWPPEYIRAVMSHGWGLATDVEPLTRLEKTIYAMDELTGLVATSALVRPSKSVLDMEARSVKKKWTDRKFAAGVDRSVIEKGATILGVSLDELITDCIMGMRTAAEEIGLKGAISASPKIPLPGERDLRTDF